MEKLISDLTQNTIQTAMKNFLHIPHGVVGNIEISGSSNMGLVQVWVRTNEVYMPVRVREDDGSGKLKHGVFKLEDLFVSGDTIGDLTTLIGKKLYLSLEIQQTGKLYNPKLRLIIADTHESSDLFTGALELCTFIEDGRYNLNPEAFQVFNVSPRFEAPVMTELTDFLDSVLLNGKLKLWNDLRSMDFTDNQSKLEINMMIDLWSIIGDQSWVSPEKEFFCIKVTGAIPSNAVDRVDVVALKQSDGLYLVYPEDRYFTLAFNLSGKGEDVSILIPGENVLFEDPVMAGDGMFFPEVTPDSESFLDQGDADPTNELEPVDPESVSVATFISDRVEEQWNVLKPSREAITYNEEQLSHTNYDTLSGLIGRGIGEQKETTGCYLFKVLPESGVQRCTLFDSIMANAHLGGSHTGEVQQIDFLLTKTEVKEISSQSRSLLSNEFRDHPACEVIFEKVETGELILLEGKGE